LNPHKITKQNIPPTFETHSHGTLDMAVPIWERIILVPLLSVSDMFVTHSLWNLLPREASLFGHLLRSAPIPETIRLREVSCSVKEIILIFIRSQKKINNFLRKKIEHFLTISLFFRVILFRSSRSGNFWKSVTTSRIRLCMYFIKTRIVLKCVCCWYFSIWVYFGVKMKAKWKRNYIWDSENCNLAIFVHLCNLQIFVLWDLYHLCLRERTPRFGRKFKLFFFQPWEIMKNKWNHLKIRDKNIFNVKEILSCSFFFVKFIHIKEHTKQWKLLKVHISASFRCTKKS